MKTFNVWLEDVSRPVYRGNSKEFGQVAIRVQIGDKIYVYHCTDKPFILNPIIKRLNSPIIGVAWKAVKALESESGGNFSIEQR